MSKPVTNVPKYQLIENEIIDAIHQGAYKADDGLPSEAELQKIYNCSRVTVRQALSNLAYKGFIYKKRGSGAFVSKHEQTVQKTPQIKSFTEDMEDLGKKPRTEVNSFSITIAGNTIAELLQISPNDRIYYIERTRFADDIPMMFERTFMSVDSHPDISIKTLEGSKYQHAEKNGMKINYSYQRIAPIFPSEYIADILKISDKQPILRVLNRTFLDDGSVFDYTELYMNPDHYQLDIIKKR